MLIDLHCHTVYSRDNMLDPAAFVQLAKQRGLDAVCVTEHNSVEASAPVARIGREEGLLVLQGVEVTTDYGHILCFGLADDGWRRRRRGYYMRFADLADCAAECDAVMVPAHPFREWSNNSVRDDLYCLDPIAAVEVLNGNNSPRENQAAGTAAHLLHLPGTGGSDSHHETEVARMATCFPASIASIGDLVSALRRGDCFPVQRGRDGVFRPLGHHDDNRPPASLSGGG